MNHNPYAPPGADVSDVASTEVQALNPWSPRGRIGRLRYIAWLSGGTFLMQMATGMAMASARVWHMDVLGDVVMVLLVLAFVVLSVFWGIQRSHDMDWSGWSVLLAFIPLVGLVWLFKGGTPGVNRFGAPPPPNSLGVKLVACLLPGLFVLGILLAISIPAYQSFSHRAPAAQTAR